MRHLLTLTFVLLATPLLAADLGSRKLSAIRNGGEPATIDPWKFAKYQQDLKERRYAARSMRRYVFRPLHYQVSIDSVAQRHSPFHHPYNTGSRSFTSTRGWGRPRVSVSLPSYYED